MKTGKTAAVLAAAMLITVPFQQDPAAAAGNASPTPAEIRAFYAEHPWTHAAPVYAEMPSAEAPYSAGSLSEQTLQEALNCLNLCRFAAGVPADIQLCDRYNEAAQAGQLVDLLNGSLVHHPQQPEGLPQEIYAQAYQGNSSSDLWCGCHDLPESVAVYLLDPGKANLETLGHRRWLLNPAMRYTGFGYVEGYTGCYVTERGREAPFTGDFIAWPPQNMPYELYADVLNGQTGYPFSVTLGADYDMPEEENVQIDLYSQMQNRTLHFSADGGSSADRQELHVDTGYYGSTNCIIFDPDCGLFDCDDVLTIRISGITKNGTEAPLSYQVQFFRLNEPESGIAESGAEPSVLACWLLCTPESAPGDPGSCDRNGDGVLDARDLSAVKQMLLAG